MGRNTGRGKVAYSWISPDPVKAEPILKVVVVVDRCRRRNHLGRGVDNRSTSLSI